MYGDWLSSVTRQFQDAFGRIEAEYNFDLGPEFEIAICNVLRGLLPRRYGVCRGFVVAKDGTTAGDDIIVFEADRYPVLRSLGEDLSRKQKVPADSNQNTNNSSGHHYYLPGGAYVQAVKDSCHANAYASTQAIHAMAAAHDAALVFFFYQVNHRINGDAVKKAHHPRSK